MSRGARFTLEQLSQMSPAIQRQVAQQIQDNPFQPCYSVPAPKPALAQQPVSLGSPRRKPRQDESRSQQEVIAWWAGECMVHGLPPNVLKAFPLQGARTPRNGARMKAEGMRAGTLDMFLGVPRGTMHGFWIEMKSPKGVVSATQKEMLRLELAQGFATVVCRSAPEAKAAIRAYLSC